MRALMGSGARHARRSDGIPQQRSSMTREPTQTRTMTQQQQETTLWASANALRSPVDPGDDGFVRRSELSPRPR